MAKDLGGDVPDPGAINTRVEFASALRAVKGERSYAQLTEGAYKLITKVSGLTEKPTWVPQRLERGTVSDWLSHGRHYSPASR